MNKVSYTVFYKNRPDVDEDELDLLRCKIRVLTYEKKEAFYVKHYSGNHFAPNSRLVCSLTLTLIYSKLIFDVVKS